MKILLLIIIGLCIAYSLLFTRVGCYFFGHKIVDKAFIGLPDGYTTEWDKTKRKSTDKFYISGSVGEHCKRCGKTIWIDLSKIKQ